MAQVWLTFGELADFMQTRPKDAEAASIAAKWDRRVSRDGATRVKLPSAVALDYMIGLVAARVGSVAGSGGSVGAEAPKALHEKLHEQ